LYSSGLLSFWWKVVKVLAFILPVSFAWWYSGSADSLQQKLIKEKDKVSLLKKSLESSEFNLEIHKESAERLEVSLNNLQKSRDKVIDERNNAWAVMGKYREDKEAYLASENLNATEQDYVECQPVPVPDSRKPFY